MQVAIFNSEKATEDERNAIARLVFLQSTYGRSCVYCGKALSEIENPYDVIPVGSRADACRECYVKNVGPVNEYGT